MNIIEAFKAKNNAWLFIKNSISTILKMYYARNIMEIGVIFYM